MWWHRDLNPGLVCLRAQVLLTDNAAMDKPACSSHCWKSGNRQFLKWLDFLRRPWDKDLSGSGRFGRWRNCCQEEASTGDRHKKTVLKGARYQTRCHREAGAWASLELGAGLKHSPELTQARAKGGGWLFGWGLLPAACSLPCWWQSTLHQWEDESLDSWKSSLRG